jgi:hypothetical protein
VLLVILMVTASYVASKAIPLELPKGATAETTPMTLSVSIDKGGRTFLDAAPIDEPALRARIRAAHAADPETRARLTPPAHRYNPYMRPHQPGGRARPPRHAGRKLEAYRRYPCQRDSGGAARDLLDLRRRYGRRSTIVGGLAREAPLPGGDAPTRSSTLAQAFVSPFHYRESDRASHGDPSEKA